MSKARDLADLAKNANDRLDDVATSDGALSNRNLIINGAMQVAQRGTSSTTEGYATVDRFKASSDATMVAANVTQSQASESPDGFPSSFKLTVNTTETAAPGDYYYVVHHIEAQNLQHLKFGLSSAESIALSFWVRSSVTGTYTVNLYRQDAARCFPKTYTVDSANIWEKKTIIIDGDTVGTIANDNGRGIDIYWVVSAGTNYTSGTDGAWQAYVGANFAANHTADVIGTSSATWQITGVQLEVGDTATPFEHRSYGDELARCQRYYIREDSSVHDYPLGSISGYCFSNTTVAVGYKAAPAMRTTPSISYANITIRGGQVDGNNTGKTVSSVSAISGNGSTVTFTVSTSSATLAFGAIATVCNTGTSPSYIEFDAEL